MECDVCHLNVAMVPVRMRGLGLVYRCPRCGAEYHEQALEDALEAWNVPTER